MAKVGSTSNSYQVLAKLASGGMAEILLVRGRTVTGVERYCVLKRILPERADNAQLVQMFFDEARLATQLQHPNIASVYDIGMLDDSYFYTMEYVHGATVRSLIQRAQGLSRALPLACVLTIAAGAAAGLHHAHERNANDGRPLEIVHRDVSPSNVMVSYEGNVKLVDFGVAKASYRELQTLPGTVKGKISYLSPEQCRSERVDRRSDLFSLGIVIWEMLTGVRLYRRKSNFEIMSAIIEEAPPRPSARRPDVPRAVDDVVLRLLTKAPAGRFQTAASVIEAIENASIREGIVLSTTATSRMMFDLFGRRAEPWQALERTRDPSVAVTFISRPIPLELERELSVLVTPALNASSAVSTQLSPPAPRTVVDPWATTAAGGAGSGTASIEVSSSLASVLHARAVAAPAEPSTPIRPTNLGLAVASSPIALPALPALHGDTLNGSRPITAEIPTRRRLASAPRTDAAPPANSVASASAGAEDRTARRPRPGRSRIAWLLAGATLVALGAVARSLGAGLDERAAAPLATVHAPAAPQVAARIVDASRAPAPEPPGATSSVQLRQEPARPAREASGPVDDRGPVAPTTARRPSPGAAARSADVKPASPSGLRTRDASSPALPAPVVATSHAPTPSTPGSSRGARPSPESVRRAFDAKDYAGVVGACSAVTVTSAIAEPCTRAACQTHSFANARRWLPLNAADQIEALENNCGELSKKPLPPPALDCSKDPLDCR